MSLTVPMETTFEASVQGLLAGYLTMKDLKGGLKVIVHVSGCLAKVCTIIIAS